MNDECEHSLINWLFRMIISWIPLYDLFSDFQIIFITSVMRFIYFIHILCMNLMNRTTFCHTDFFLRFSIHFYFPHHLN